MAQTRFDEVTSKTEKRERSQSRGPIQSSMMAGVRERYNGLAGEQHTNPSTRLRGVPSCIELAYPRLNTVLVLAAALAGFGRQGRHYHCRTETCTS